MASISMPPFCCVVVYWVRSVRFLKLPLVKNERRGKGANDNKNFYNNVRCNEYTHPLAIEDKVRMFAIGCSPIELYIYIYPIVL